MKFSNSNTNLDIDTREFCSKHIKTISELLKKTRDKNDVDVVELDSQDIKDKFNTDKDINNSSNKIAHSLRRLLVLNLVFKRSKKKNKRQIAKDNNLENLISDKKEVLKSLENCYIKSETKQNEKVLKIYSERDSKISFKRDSETISLFTSDKIKSIRTSQKTD